MKIEEIALRNLHSFVASATFKGGETDRQSASNCIDLLAALQRQLSEAVQGRDEAERELAIEKTRSHGDWSNQRENDALTIRFYEMKERAEKAERERDAAQANAFDAAVAHGNARRHADAAEAEVARLREALPLVETALSHASFALDGVIAMDDEDMGKDGGSATCQDTQRTVDRALKSLRAALQRGEPK
ncbi:hypothetical protein QV13_12555 [Mesorhizobium hungaricum]|jgi:hypothetical protein|uniref:Uncharacterized protein n=1 Tax=Mesorhizobium hungaricum TaxID=1566387 RepID=A0A1C2DSE1_9HYPH|nr:MULTISPECIES: hypothetical protein [Mesorhizobium]MBN9236056.1 hypothetical protein [Mesorhizobium sp.]OCX17583.1 hypothetical protein QV13_12555 [Mesorhizobium hungaricum]